MYSINKQFMGEQWVFFLWGRTEDQKNFLLHPPFQARAKKGSTRGGSRTHDLTLRRRTRYPTALPGLLLACCPVLFNID